MAHCLHPQYFNNQVEAEFSVKEFFVLKDKNWYHHGIKVQAERNFT